MKNLIPICLLLCVILFSSVYAQDSNGGAPVEVTGFGLQSEIFRNVRNVNTDFTKNFSIMSGYRLTPGDVFSLTVTTGIRSDGSISNAQDYVIQLQDDFTMNVPFIGVLNVRGKSLPELHALIDRRIRNIVPAQYINFVLSSPAQFNVFVYGGVNLPGYIVANPLLTVIDAIGIAKGFKPSGSYRKVQLIRTELDGTETVTELDVSRFYRDADFDSNPSLNPKDKIYVPAADIVAVISGKISFPGVYELIEGESLEDLVRLSGGSVPDALTSRIEVVRIEKNGNRTVHTVDLKDAGGFMMQNGDRVSLRSTSENSDMITVEGAVFGSRLSGETAISVPPNPVRMDLPYYSGISVLSALDTVGGPTPYAILPESYVERAETGEKVEIDIGKLWETRSQDLNRELFPGDRVFIPMENLKVFITGNVADPGAFTFRSGTTVWDYILLAGGIVEEIGDPKGLYLLDSKGNKTKVSSTTEVYPGAHIYVSKKLLYAANQTLQYALITTSMVTTVWVVVKIINEIVASVRDRSIPAP